MSYPPFYELPDPEEAPKKKPSRKSVVFSSPLAMFLVTASAETVMALSGAQVTYLFTLCMYVGLGLIVFFIGVVQFSTLVKSLKEYEDVQRWLPHNMHNTLHLFTAIVLAIVVLSIALFWPFVEGWSLATGKSTIFRIGTEER